MVRVNGQLYNLFDETTPDNYKMYLKTALSEGVQFRKLNFFKSMIQAITARAGKDVTQDLMELTPLMLNQSYEEMMELCERIANNKDQDWSHLIPVTEYYCPKCGGSDCGCHDLVSRRGKKKQAPGYECPHKKPQ